MFKQLYKALVRPHLEYASVIWIPYYKYQKILIENVQRKATRLLSSLKKQKLSYNERLTKLCLPTHEYRGERGDMLQTFRIVKSKCWKYWQTSGFEISGFGWLIQDWRKNVKFCYWDCSSSIGSFQLISPIRCYLDQSLTLPDTTEYWLLEPKTCHKK